MYDIIKSIINHDWASTNSTEQSVIYYICGACIIIFSVVFLDFVYRIFSNFWSSRK